MNLTPIDFNYLDGKNTYPIQDYIDDKITSNITTSNILISSNIYLNNAMYYSGCNLVITNKAPFGDLCFKNSYNYPNSNGAYGTKVDYTGKLLVYHNYNILQPTFGEGYYDVEGELLALKADGINTDAQFIGIEGSLVFIQNEIDTLRQAGNLVEGQVNTLVNELMYASSFEQFQGVTRSTNFPQIQANYGTLMTTLNNNAQTLFIDATLLGGATSIIFAFTAGAIASASASLYYRNASNSVFNNSNFTSNQIYPLYNSYTSNEIKNYSNYNYSISNMELYNGFINCNITKTQFIPSLNTNSLKLNNVDINNIYSTYTALNSCNYITNATNGLLNYPNYTTLNSCNYITNATNGLLNYPNYTALNSCNYLPKTGGALTGTLSTNSSITGFTALNGGSATLTQVLTTNNTNTAVPSTGNGGGLGDKILLTNGTATTYPNSLGVESGGAMWLSSSNILKFYNNGINTMCINNNGNIGIGTTTTLANAFKLDVRGPLIANNIFTVDSFYNYALTFITQTNGVSIIQNGALYNNYAPDLNIQSSAGNLVLGNPTSNIFMNSSNVGINNSVPQGLLHLGNVNNNSDGNLVFSKRTAPGTQRNFKIGFDSSYNFVLGDFGSASTTNTWISQMFINYSSPANSLTINSSGNVGFGTNNANGTLELYSTIQSRPRLILSGQEFYTNTTIVTGGIALLCGVNRTGNRQLWIGDSLNLAQNATNQILRLGLGGIDALATNGTTPLPIFYGNTSTQTSINGSSILLNGNAYFKIDVWNYSTDNQQRLYFGNNSTTYIQGQGGTPIIFRNNANQDLGNFSSGGDFTATAQISTGANSYLYAGGLRIGGFDGNTFYSGNRNIGMTFNNGYNFTVNSWTGNGTILSISNSQIAIIGYIGITYNITANNAWLQYTSTSPSGVGDSLIFQHRDTTTSKNSFWWFNGSQSTTSSEISDKRSKYNIQDFKALEIIKKLKPKSFDVINDKDINSQFGFIAQDIEEEIPELSKLVYTTNDYIANVNSYGNHTNQDGECIITANDDLTGKINIGDEIKFVSNNQVDKEFIIDATPYINRYKRRYAKITEILSPTEFKVDCEINNFCSIEDPFLIYGKKVNDAKSLDYNSFIALNTKAIQELYEIIKKQQETIDLLLSKIN